ncbi:MAG: ABC transporter ATP-binding protein/permease [Oscillospiraceae bacterium]|jgi:ATP-binding cassette subfamily B protein|nr:ABC transporter ATP-binding protein/permease [Oscillospiraceae bacterium]
MAADSKRRKRQPKAEEVKKEEDKAKDFRGAMQKVFRYLAAYKGTMLIVIVFAVASTALAVIGPKILSRATTELFNGLVAKFTGTGGIDFPKIFQILIAVLGLYLVSLTCALIQGWMMATLSQKVSYNLRRDICSKINRMPMKYFESRTVGEILSRITNDVDTLGMSLNQSVAQLITSICMIIGVAIMMISISPLMFLITVGILPLSGWLLNTVVKKSQKHFNIQQEYLGVINGQTEETIGGHSIVKLFNHETQSEAAYEESNKVLYKSAWMSQFLSGLLIPTMQFIGHLGYVAVAISGGILAFSGTISVGDIQAYIQYVRQFTAPMAQLAQIFQMLQSMAAAAERVFEFLEEEEEAADPADSLAAAQGEVEFEHVKFGYDDTKIVINDFSGRVYPGETIAIVGPTGAGKTTMVKLLMRFYDVISGAIRVDGHDVRSISRKSLRENIGMVLQDTWLFNGTIRENIRYGKLDAAEEDIIAAAKAAHADSFIRTLPEGYDTVLGEESENISQGQKQLLTIARAILADKPMLILDEATSSVDTHTEQQIQKAMHNLMRGRTSFVIAHRLSTIRDADNILVMRDGDIAEQGRHRELLDKGGFYAELYNSQFEETESA